LSTRSLTDARLLKARIDGGRHGNWLPFGERNRAHDFPLRDELQDGALAAILGTPLLERLAAEGRYRRDAY
jgi:sulfite reductase alpha subunit-like flavoprotein